MTKLSIDDIVDAGNRIATFVHHTPVVASSLLNRWLGHEIFFKAECLQRVGAFKARGACNTISWLLENGQKPARVVSNSSGNHAQAVAWAASQYNIPATIFMPNDASTVKAQATRSYGAEVVLCEDRKITDEMTIEASEETGTYWIPPFDHEQIICGQGTAAYEALQEIGDVDAVVAPCGGGGLLSGTLISTRALCPSAKVIGAEPLNGNDATLSWRTGTLQSLSESPDTLADGARTLSLGPLTFEYIKQLDEMFEVDDERIIYWMQWMTHLLKLHVEPTSAMVMEAVCCWLATRKTPKRVMVIISGGNIDQPMMRTLWREDHLCTPPTLLSK